MDGIRVLLPQDDPVFLHRGKAYALVSERGGWCAHEVTEVEGQYFRSRLPAQLETGVVAGVIHQQEHFRAADLHKYWRRADSRKVRDDCDEASANVARITRRTTRMMDSLCKKR